MDFLIFILLAFDLKVLAFNYPYRRQQNSNKVEVVDYNALGQGICPKVKQPLCATNGVKFLYFENKCLLEVKNYDQLVQGLQEFYECPLSYCSSPQCAPCGIVHEPVCAIEVVTGQMENFPNPCEVERRICTTQREYHIISAGQCSPNSNLQHDCPEFCTLEYNPVCAQFDTEVKEFANQCELQKAKCETKANWQIVDLSDCASISINSVFGAFKSSSQNYECPQLCTLEYQPICARFMSLEKEFSNECELKTTICQTKQKWDIIRRGPCQETNDNTNIQLLDPKTSCSKFCTLEYRPICAKFNNELREFSNNCDLERTICETNDKWEVVVQGPCFSPQENENTKCPEICTLEYRPICAKYNNELREFSNNCDLQRTICQTNEKWEIINHGPCYSYQKPKCPQFCNLIYRPICAIFNNELREFSNNCDLQRTICQTNEKWEIINQGPCNSDQSDQKPKCPQFCTLEYRPICARLRNELRVFSNNCALQRTICETNQKWKIVKQGTCFTHDSECPQFCTREYKPVCAEFRGEQREFSNKCELLRAICETYKKWEVVKLGTCSKNSPKLLRISSPCPQFCTQEYKPVCAKYNNELREFSNSCELNRYNCESNEEWETVNSGTCSPVSSDLLTSQATCPKFCTREYDPICAKLDNELREFPNKCELQRVNCESDKTWEIVNLGPCTSNSRRLECPKLCTEEYGPVCAEFKSVLREFGNKCDLQRTICQTYEDWKLVNEGPCLSKSPVKPICPKLCTKEYNPVCARFNGELREFPNDCEFQRSVCETNVEWELLYVGPCLNQRLKSDSVNCDNEELDPICAILDFSVKTFNNICQLSEEIKSTGSKWSILHKGICSTTTTYATSSTTTARIPTLPSRLADKESYSESYSTTTTKTMPTTITTTQTTVKPKYYTTTAKPYTTSTTAKITTTSETTVGPKYTTLTTTDTPITTTMSQYSTTRKPATTAEPKSSTSKKTTIKPKYSSTAETTTTLKTTLKPEYTTTTKTITATTTAPATTTVSYTKYTSTSSSTSTHDPYVYEYNIEEDSDEVDDCSKENDDEHDGNCGCSSHEDKDYNSQEYNSWEEKEEEEDDQEEEVVDESSHSYDIEDDTYTYKHNDSDSSYTFIYGNDLTTPYNEVTEGATEGSIYLNEEYSKKDNSENKYSINKEQYVNSSTNKQSKEYLNKHLNNPTLIESTVVHGKENYENLPETFDDGDENLEAYISYEEYKPEAPAYTEKSQPVSDDYGPASVKEPMFGVYSSEAYGLVEPTESNKNPKFYNQNQPEEPLYNNDNIENGSYETSTIYQYTENSYPENSTPIQKSSSDNITKTLEIFEALLSESDAEEEDDETLVKQVLTSKTTAAYPIYEETENQLNHTKRAEYPSKYNNTNSKKGEIYNGVVYKAPVYDAPTYNFIYTAPNHPVYSLPPSNSPLLNYPGIMPNYADPAVSHYNPFLPPFNHSTMGAPALDVPGANVPFNPVQFLSSLAAAAASHATSLPSEDTQINALVAESTQSNRPLSHSTSPVYNHILPHTHPSPLLFLPLPPEQFLSPPNMLSLTQKRENRESQQLEENPNNIESSSGPEIYESEQPPYPFPALQTSMSYLSGNQQLQQPQPLLQSLAYQYPPQLLTMPYHHPSAPLQFSPPAPFTAFNATLINQIAETLKTITSRY